VKSPNVKYIAGVDHLRAFAALLIIFYHGFQLYSHKIASGTEVFSQSEWVTEAQPLMAVIVEGHSSVALFMVLSGFIFTVGSVGREIVYRQFFLNRLYRIFPLFIFLMACAVSFHGNNYNFLGVVQSLLFQGNYSGSVQGGQFLSMTWAIAVEFQFYLVFPFLLRFYEKYGVPYLLGVLLTFVCLRIVGHFEGGDTHGAAYWTILGRMDQFIVGILCGAAYAKRGVQLARLRYAFPLSVVAVVWWLHYFNHHGGYPLVHWNRIFWPTADAVVWGQFILTYLPVSARLPAIISRPLAFVGEISFSIYLLHFVVIQSLIHSEYVFAFSRERTSSALLNTLLVTLPLTLALSVLTYFVVEKPFLEMRRSYHRLRALDSMPRP
jgi:peptidoglycan/LPS O-acetylase OafA/YrhL